MMNSYDKRIELSGKIVNAYYPYREFLVEGEELKMLDSTHPCLVLFGEKHENGDLLFITAFGTSQNTEFLHKGEFLLKYTSSNAMVTGLKEDTKWNINAGNVARLPRKDSRFFKRNEDKSLHIGNIPDSLKLKIEDYINKKEIKLLFSDLSMQSNIMLNKDKFLLSKYIPK